MGLNAWAEACTQLVPDVDKFPGHIACSSLSRSEIVVPMIVIKKIDYKDFEGAIKDWIKCAFYLGVVFSKTTEDHLSFFLGVDTKWKVI